MFPVIRAYKRVDLADLNCEADIYVRSLSKAETEQLASDETFIIAVVCNDKGLPLLTDPKQIDEIPIAVLHRILDTAISLQTAKKN